MLTFPTQRLDETYIDYRRRAKPAMHEFAEWAIATPRPSGAPIPTEFGPAYSACYHAMVDEVGREPYYGEAVLMHAAVRYVLIGRAAVKKTRDELPFLGPSSFEVIERPSNVSHGRYETLDEARGCVAFDRLGDFEIWQGDHIVEEACV